MANRFVDREKVSGTLTGTCTFTNGSTTVSGSGTSFTTELAVGNYIKPSTAGYNEWYKVASIESDTSLTLAYAFAQATVTDPANSTQKNAENGTTPTNAFAHINQATTDEVRAAGDVIFIRRNQTHVYQATNIVFDEDGAINNFITLMGDDGTGWPDETGLARPTIDFAGNDERFYLWDDDFWKFKDLILNGGTHVSGHLTVGGKDFRASNCVFQNCTGGGYGVVFVYEGLRPVFESCAWNGNSNNSLKLFTSYATLAVLKDCTFDGNATCISCNSGSSAFLTNCSFGVTTANTGYDINIGAEAAVRVIGRNVTLNDTNKVNITTAAVGSYVKIEDYQGQKLNNQTWLPNGTIIRNTTVVRTGGATSSAEITPNDGIGLEQPIELCSFAEELSRWLAAGAHSVSIWIQGSGWTTFPTANELYVEALYYDGATAKRATTKSTAVLTANNVWTEFPVSFTLNSDSPCYANVILKRYEAGAKIWVDILPVWS